MILQELSKSNLLRRQDFRSLCTMKLHLASWAYLYSRLSRRHCEYCQDWTFLFCQYDHTCWSKIFFALIAAVMASVWLYMLKTIRIVSDVADMVSLMWIIWQHEGHGMLNYNPCKWIRASRKRQIADQDDIQNSNILLLRRTKSER